VNPARALAALLVAAPLFADAGAILLREQTGAIRITVFAAPAPLRAGPADISVLVQDASSGEPLLDATVRLRLSLPGEGQTLLPATHVNATNRMLYAAPVVLQKEGRWRLEGDVRARSQNTHFQTDVIVLPPEGPLITWWPYFALPAAAILLFTVNQHLKRRARSRGASSYFSRL
jgi:hypothetical protein